MKKRVYFVRHGLTDWNLEHRVQGRIDIPLNLAGEEQARNLARRLSDLKVDRIVSSPLKRAARTAEILSESFRVPISYNENLRERDFGDAEGMLRSDMLEKYGDYIIFDGKWINWGKSFIPTGETLEEHRARLAKSLREIFSNGAFDNVLVSTHGANMSVFTRMLGLNNCACVSAAYDTETEEISDIECICAGGA
jgi:uncharacterized phosphatase